MSSASIKYWRIVVAAAAETQSDVAMHNIYLTRQACLSVGPSMDMNACLRIFCLIPHPHHR